MASQATALLTRSTASFSVVSNAMTASLPFNRSRRNSGPCSNSSNARNGKDMDLHVAAPADSAFRRILKDEAFHMNYTYTQLRRVSPRRHGLRLWVARASRLWKGYLRLSVAVAGVMGWFMLLVQYFFILGPFSLLAKRAAKKEPEGWAQAKPAAASTLSSQYR